MKLQTLIIFSKKMNSKELQVLEAFSIVLATSFYFLLYYTPIGIVKTSITDRSSFFFVLIPLDPSYNPLKAFEILRKLFFLNLMLILILASALLIKLVIHRFQRFINNISLVLDVVILFNSVILTINLITVIDRYVKWSIPWLYTLEFNSSPLTVLLAILWMLLSTVSIISSFLCLVVEERKM